MIEMAVSTVAVPSWAGHTAAFKAGRKHLKPNRVVNVVHTFAQQQDQAASAVAAPAPAAAAAAGEAFASLSAAHLDLCRVTLLPCGPQGNGLVVTADAAQGDVLLRVPLSCCLAVNYAAGLVLPAGQWPRLRKGVAKDAALPWDILLALALLDGLAGGGDAFWDAYANAVLPGPLGLTLPLCFPPQLMAELQHASIIGGALAQQERLAGLLPGLNRSMLAGQEQDGGAPSWLQWGFGCVRSRAFKLGQDFFAFVPFLDLANHASQPTSDFRLSADGSCVELVALKDLQAGDEATITYSGQEGLTNQRFMAQYGFTPASNPADRLRFAALDAPPAAAGSASASPAVLLSLDRMMAAMGDNSERLGLAMSGRDPFAYAALKSLPFAVDEGAAAALDAQLALTQRLHAELAAEAAAWPTSLAEDSSLVQGWQQAQEAGSSSGSGSGSPDPRLVAAVEYRMRRKALVKTCMGLLSEFSGV